MEPGGDCASYYRGRNQSPVRQWRRRRRRSIDGPSRVAGSDPYAGCYCLTDSNARSDSDAEANANSSASANSTTSDACPTATDATTGAGQHVRRTC